MSTLSICSSLSLAVTIMPSIAAAVIAIVSPPRSPLPLLLRWPSPSFLPSPLPLLPSYCHKLLCCYRTFHHCRHCTNHRHHCHFVTIAPSIPLPLLLSCCLCCRAITSALSLQWCCAFHRRCCHADHWRHCCCVDAARTIAVAVALSIATIAVAVAVTPSIAVAIVAITFQLPLHHCVSIGVELPLRVPSSSLLRQWQAFIPYQAKRRQQLQRWQRGGGDGRTCSFFWKSFC